MARYIVRHSYIDIIGGIWWPIGQMCAMRKELSSYDIANLTDTEGRITRDNVEPWVLSHSGDFSSVKDFRASIEHSDETIDIEWAYEDSELTYNDCMFPAEDE